MSTNRTYEQIIGWEEDDTSWGVWQAASMWAYFPKVTVPQPVLAKLDAASARGEEAPDIRDIAPGYQYATFTIAGVWPVVTSDPALLFLLKHILPDVTIAGAGADKTHTFEPYETFYSTGLSFSSCFGLSERYKMSGCRPTRLKFSGTAGGFVNFEMDFVGKWQGRDQTMDTPSITMKTTYPIWMQSPFLTVTFQIPTGSDRAFHAWEITYNVQVDPAEAMSGQLGYSGPVQLARLGATLNAVITRRADFTDGTGSNQSYFNELWEQMKTDGASLSDVQLKIAYVDGAIGVTGSSYTLQLEANVAVDPDQPPPGEVDTGQPLLMEQINLTGYMDGTNELLKITTISECATPTTGTP